MGWSITPDTGLASIDQNGVFTYQEHTSDVTYTISYNDDEGCSKSKSVTIPACTSCDCSDLTVSGITNIVAKGGSNITIGSFSNGSCMSNPRASSSESWLSNIKISGNDIKANVEDNTAVLPETSDTRDGSVTITVDKEGGDTCEKTMTISQVWCEHPDETITILIYRSDMPPRNTTFYLLDAKITESTSEETQEWIRTNGYKYLSPSDIFEDITIGKYEFVGCDVISNFITSHKYCSISSGTLSNKTLEVGGRYYCYFWTSNQWINTGAYVMPSARYCQEHVLPFRTDCYVISEH